MTKDDVLAAMRRHAKNGHLSLRDFCALSGISDRQFLGVYWATWNEAKAEAGLGAQRFEKPRTDDRDATEALVQFIERVGRWPSERELTVERRLQSTFPSIKVLRRVLNARNVAAHCADRSDLPDAASIADKRLETEPVAVGSTKAQINGYVYMMRSGRNFKIGKTVDPSRRHREVRLELPTATVLVHSIATDDPTGIEDYWHKRFKAKQIRETEFFKLDASDVAAFKRRKYQ